VTFVAVEGSDGAALRRRRVAAGCSQREFADSLGITQQRLSEIELGKLTPSELRTRADDQLTRRERSGGVEPARPQTEVLKHPLAVARALRGLSRAELASSVAEKVGGAGNSNKVYRWERRGVVPDEGTQRVLADIFEVPASKRLAMPWPAWLPGTEGVDVEAHWSLHSALAALDSTAGEAMLDRRGFLTLTTTAVADLAALWAVAPYDLFPADAVRDGSADDLVTAFDSRVPGLRAHENQYGGGRSRSLLHAELNTATVLLKQPIGSAARDRLLRAAAELARLAGWASFDAGMLAASERYFVTGLRAAHVAGDRVSGANIVKSMALLYAESGRAQDALVLISAARKVTARAPARLRAMLAVREARCAPHLDRRTSAMLCSAKRPTSWTRPSGRPTGRLRSRTSASVN